MTEVARRSPAITTPVEDCQDLEGLELAYRVDYVRGDSLVLGLTGDDGTPTRLPDRACFGVGFSYQIRATDEWLALGSSSELIQDRGPLSKQCVPETGNDRIVGRLVENELFQNVYYSLAIESGTVDPLADMTILFTIANNFAVVALDTGPMPIDIDMTTSVAGRRTLISDGGLSLVYVFDADTLATLPNLQ